LRRSLTIYLSLLLLTKEDTKNNLVVMRSKEEDTKNNLAAMRNKVAMRIKVDMTKEDMKTKAMTKEDTTRFVVTTRFDCYRMGLRC